MKKWMNEDWEFEVTVSKGSAEQCRMGLEEGDKFSCRYDCPAGFCPKTMPVLHIAAGLALHLKIRNLRFQLFKKNKVIYKYAMRIPMCSFKVKLLRSQRQNIKNYMR